MQYELITLKDVFDKVPADRIKACLHEMAIAMQQTKAMEDLLGAAGSELAGDEFSCHVQWPETSIWIDDGKGEIDLMFHSDAGDDLFNYKVQLAQDGNAQEIECAHTITQGREGQSGSWCDACGEKVLGVDDRECKDCDFAKKLIDGWICKKHLMAIPPDMNVTFKIAEGSCWTQSNPACQTCKGRGVIGGFVSIEAGYQDDPCPECSGVIDAPEAIVSKEGSA